MPLATNSGRLRNENRGLAFLLGVAGEIDCSVQAPYNCQNDGEDRFLPTTKSFQWSNDIEGKAGEISDRTENRHDHVLKPMKRVMFLESHDTNDVGEAVQHEGAEVRQQRHQQQSVRQ